MNIDLTQAMHVLEILLAADFSKLVLICITAIAFAGMYKKKDNYK